MLRTRIIIPTYAVICLLKFYTYRSSYKSIGKFSSLIFEQNILHAFNINIQRTKTHTKSSK